MLQHHSHVIKDLLRVTEEAVRKRGRRLSWLRFAKRRTPQGYAFFLQKDIPWDVIHEIVSQVYKLHPQYAYATVADIASEFFTMDEDELAQWQSA